VNRIAMFNQKDQAPMPALLLSPLTASLVIAVVTLAATQASAQPPAPRTPPAKSKPLFVAPDLTRATDEPRSVWSDLFVDTAQEVRQLPSRDSLGWLAIGGAAALLSHPADPDVTRRLASSEPLHETLEAGAIVGSTPAQLGAALVTYALGRAIDKPRVRDVGADLVQAQLLAEGFTWGIKHATRRNRPEGSGFSFPSGHTTVTFSSATVLQRHFGWKAGIPSYAVAAYVAASRVQMKRHNLSDVAFGAALGIVIGRTVTIGKDHALLVSPLAVPGGTGASFTWLGKDDPRRKP
jgi:hypothetical protein